MSKTWVRVEYQKKLKTLTCGEVCTVQTSILVISTVGGDLVRMVGSGYRHVSWFCGTLHTAMELEVPDLSFHCSVVGSVHHHRGHQHYKIDQTF